MLSKNQAKIIQSLRLKKFRQKYNLFVAEGTKMLETILQSRQYKIKTLYHSESIPQSIQIHPEITQVSIDQRMMKSISFLKNPSPVLILVETLENQQNFIRKGIFLDGVQDPGNVGTIIRIADWFGYDTVIRSPDSADFYSPKVIQSTMGAFSNIQLLEWERETLLESKHQLIVADLDGTPLEQLDPTESHILVVGSEGQGVSTIITNHESIQKVRIEGHSDKISESLNVSIATGIICSRLSINSF